jgi:sortase A
MKKHKTVIFLTLGFLVGVCILLYPAVSDYWISKVQSRAVMDYETALNDLKPEDYTKLFNEAHAYNKELYETNFPMVDYPQISGYDNALSVTENNMIGYDQADRLTLYNAVKKNGKWVTTDLCRVNDTIKKKTMTQQLVVIVKNSI